MTILTETGSESRQRSHCELSSSISSGGKGREEHDRIKAGMSLPRWLKFPAQALRLLRSHLRRSLRSPYHRYETRDWTLNSVHAGVFCQFFRPQDIILGQTASLRCPVQSSFLIHFDTKKMGAFLPKAFMSLWRNDNQRRFSELECAWGQLFFVRVHMKDFFGVARHKIFNLLPIETLTFLRGHYLYLSDGSQILHRWARASTNMNN